MIHSVREGDTGRNLAQQQVRRSLAGDNDNKVRLKPLGIVMLVNKNVPIPERIVAAYCILRDSMREAR